ncbi:hypothetical protein LG331_09740 [Vreelandella aquamarina]|uniref:hypothetical protein n=1 Tax=Vreelandella aquamarina TaxID=77097 RepID=UPI00384F4C12
MSNLDGLAFPVACGSDDAVDPGFTKRERACIDLRIPETDDPELNALITKARRQEVAAKIAAGLSAATDDDGTWSHDPGDVAFAAASYADALIHQLDNAHDCK